MIVYPTTLANPPNEVGLWVYLHPFRSLLVFLALSEMPDSWVIRDVIDQTPAQRVELACHETMEPVGNKISPVY